MSQETHPLYSQQEAYKASAARGNGVSFTDWLVLREMEKKYPANRVRVESHTDNRPSYYFVTYNGVCADYPRRSFRNFDAARRYMFEVKRHLGEI